MEKSKSEITVISVFEATRISVYYSVWSATREILFNIFSSCGKHEIPRDERS